MKKVITQFAFIVLAVSMVFISDVRAATINADSCSQAHVQAAVNAAVDGDTVIVPAGNETWASCVIWINKNICVIGAGIGNTNIAVAVKAFTVVATTKASFRISGMTFSGTTGGTGVISILASSGVTSVKGWRLDHLRFNYSTACSVHPIYITGIAWGVIDHCIFDGPGYVSITSYGYIETDPAGNLGNASWLLPLNLGTDEAIYVEDCEFNFSNDACSAVNDLFYGGRMVIRHNTITHGFIQTHSARYNARGGLKLEIYNNTFIGNGFIRPAHIRSGTGVIFNNTVSGYRNNNFVIDNQRTCLEMSNRCDGNDTIRDGNTLGEFGWPCWDQIGRSSGGTLGNQPSEPLYAWNNGDSVIVLNWNFDLCGSDAPPNLSTHLKTTGDASPHAGGVLDYVNNGIVPKPDYTPYTYPHPLTKPAPPKNLQIKN